MSAETATLGTPAGTAGAPGGVTDRWAGYADGIRALWLAGAKARERHAGAVATAVATGTALDHLTVRLAAQRRHLIDLAVRLRLPRPRIDPALPGHPADRGDAIDALRLAIEACDAADAAAREAVWRGQRAALLPDLPPAARGAVVYGGWALAGWLLQCLSLLVTPEAAFMAQIWSLCGLPLLAYAGGHLTMVTAGRPRLADRAAAPPIALGLVICLVGMPLAWLLLIAGRGLL